ncbi:MAG: radical SAM family heme chaperone HemW [Ruminococcaceae bacterium]|nr:radical SAM family heme chaperone HemW [Oscillospiraceae bacterium]
MDRTDKTGLYFHIPFCKSRCPYCDFYSNVSSSCPDEYIKALVDEIKTKRRLGEFIPRDEKIQADTVYFGGGTPSLMTARQLNEILSAVRESFILSEDAEITVECNPSSENLADFLYDAAGLGVNRISLGMQSAVDSERRALGRKGTAADVIKAVDSTRKAGIENISLDIMAGVPDSSIETLKESLSLAVALGVPHISSYMLKIEEGTYYYRHRDSLNIPSEDETADMYLFMSDFLLKNGFIHYEISNFCKDGFYSRHNKKYWLLTDYIGFGAAAHSFYGGKRFFFPPDKDAFIRGDGAVFDSLGGDGDERLLLGLRLKEGISLEGRSGQFINKINFYEKCGLGEIYDGRFSLTPRGFLLSNSVIIELLDCR